MELIPEANLAKQQPNKPLGSNSLQQLSGGWPSYEFSDGTQGFGGILRRENGEPSLRLWSKSTAETPNRFSVEFQDELNGFQQDSVSEIDLDDVIQVGQEISATLPALGLPHFDQAFRVLRCHLQKGTRGNLFMELESSVKALALRPGDLITKTYPQEGLMRAPFRVQTIAPSLDFHRVRILAQVHDDSWYSSLDGLGAAGGGLGRVGNVGAVAPRPIWGTSTNEYGDAVFDATESALALSDGSNEVRLKLRFSRPSAVSSVSHLRPIVALTAGIELFEGGLAGGRDLYYAISAVNGGSEETGLSFLVVASLPNTGSEFAVTLSGLKAPTGFDSLRVYRCTTPQGMRRIAEVTAASGAFRDPGMPDSVALPPDAQYHHANFYTRLELSPALNAETFGATEIGNLGLSMISDEYRGNVVRIVRGPGAGQEAVVLGNSDVSLTLDRSWNPPIDQTSLFVISERDWKFQGATEGDEAEILIPNRFGMMLQVQGRSANLLEAASSPEISPVFRWTIGGTAGSQLDLEVPPQPVFGLAPTRGAVELKGIGFPTFENTKSISAGTLKLYYWAEDNGLPQHSVAVDFDSEDLVIQGNASAAIPGQYVQIDEEIVQIESLDPSREQYTIVRAQLGTSAAPHSRGAVLWALDLRTATFGFPREFFGSLASGSYSGVVPLGPSRIAAAEFFVTNLHGNSPTATAPFTETVDGGLRILPGGQYVLQLPGHAAVQSNCVAPLVVDDFHVVRDVIATVGSPPTHLPLVVRVTLNEQPYCDLSIPAGVTQSNWFSGMTLPPLDALSIIGLDILSVGTGEGVEPGRDLTVTIRL